MNFEISARILTSSSALISLSFTSSTSTMLGPYLIMSVTISPSSPLNFTSSTAEYLALGSSVSIGSSLLISTIEIFSSFSFFSISKIEVSTAFLSFPAASM
ncbi:100aa long hypothetical protein [Pyrococcus horikoshii OT3]|uniref:Uncharacterized protein n=1 Tax=Pyrococcus horikoshii (strain ATCC 700860 / DSM 12428 / JCM 9974 / NBRC 100139 / OT-3) TaxID=70601 RepID=O50101_PYRHO|nr:100aa long hypothetical protein [Pyrococcus horikoshii OT3]